MHKDWYITLAQGSEKLERKAPLIEYYWYGVTDKWVICFWSRTDQLF